MSLATTIRAKQAAALADNAPHVIVLAYAGTGKTTSLVEGLKVTKGMKTKFKPSPQQKAIWDTMALSRHARSILFCAFGKDIAVELQERVPEGCQASTLHSMGLKAVLKQFGRINILKGNERVHEVIAELTGKDIWTLRRDDAVFLSGVTEIVGLCKQNLVQLPPEDFEEQLEDLATHYDVDLNGTRQRVFELVPKVLERCKHPEVDRKIDFNDMIWLPVILDLPVFQFDLLLVDEAQDLNRCQQALALKAGRRLILCGDSNQAIYGFAGADTQSLERMAQILGATERGCVTLPLTVTRRCGKAIVEEARKYVSDFEAHEDNPDGAIKQVRHGNVKQPWTDEVEDGDMILSRVNAPLVSLCYRFLKADRKANILGKKVGEGLIALVKRMKAKDVPDLQTKLGEWLEGERSREMAKKFPSEDRLVNIQDKHDCVSVFMEGEKQVELVINKIDRIFTADKQSPGIRLSSVHKAKGLEANRVFIFKTKNAPMPHPMAQTDWAKGQEVNLLYVAITRAIQELTYVLD
jgi:superfamily I DNA/RNA helicase